MLRKLIIHHRLPLVFANVPRECLGHPFRSLPTLISTVAISVSESLSQRASAALATGLPRLIA
jgi:hypothetical protein